MADTTNSADAANEVRDQVHDLFAGVLSVQKVSLDDDFFALGGHSLTAGRVIGLIHRRFGVKVNLIDFFQEPTVRGLTDRVVSGRAGLG